MPRLRMIFALSTVVLIASLLGLPNSRSAPKGGSAVPPGKILYTYNNQGWEMNGDGSGKTAVSMPVVSIPVVAVPSQDTYSGHRWSVLTSNGEVWATPNNVDFLQITNLQQHDNGDGTITYIMLDNGFGGRMTWSNGGDSFISVAAAHWVQDASLPPGGDVSDFYNSIYRLDVSALELEARFQLGLPGPALDITQVVPVITETFGYASNFNEHHWSPDGTKMAFLWRNQNESGAREVDLWVADVGPGVTLPVDAVTLPASNKIFDGGLYDLNFIQWSPPGAAEQRIVFNLSYPRSHMTVRIDGTGLTTVASNTYGPCFWSPDGNHLVYRHGVLRGYAKSIDNLYRIGATGGTPVLLTKDLNNELDKGLLGWGN